MLQNSIKNYNLLSKHKIQDYNIVNITSINKYFIILYIRSISFTNKNIVKDSNLIFIDISFQTHQ